MNKKMTATEAINAYNEESRRDILNRRLECFFEKHAPDDKLAAAGFYADFMMVVQEIHRDANMHTHELLRQSLASIPPMMFRVPKPETE